MIVVGVVQVCCNSGMMHGQVCCNSGVVHGQVCCNGGVVHGLFIVGSLVFVVVGGLMGDILALVVMTGLVGGVLASGVEVVTLEGVVSMSAIFVGVVAVMDGLVCGVVLAVRNVVVVMRQRLVGSCVVLTMSGVAIFTVLILSRSISDNCAEDEGFHTFKFDSIFKL